MAAPEDGTPGAGSTEMPSRTTRAFVLGFLGIFVVCGLASLEVWPLTGWHLFSRLRTGREPGWQVTLVDPAGVERFLPFADLPLSYRGWSHVAAGLGSRSPEERRRVCRAWADAAARLGGPTVAGVRIYATGATGRPGPPPRSLRYSCSPGADP